MSEKANQCAQKHFKRPRERVKNLAQGTVLYAEE